MASVYCRRLHCWEWCSFLCKSDMLYYLVRCKWFKQRFCVTDHSHERCQWWWPIPSAHLSKFKIPLLDLFARTPRHLYITGMLESLNIVFECPLERDLRCDDKMWSREWYKACSPFLGRMLSVDCLGININGLQRLRSRNDRPMLWSVGRGGEYKSLWTCNTFQDNILAWIMRNNMRGERLVRNVEDKGNIWHTCLVRWGCGGYNMIVTSVTN